MAAENDQQRRQRESGGNIESTLAALVGVLIVFLVVMVCIQIVNVVSERSIEEPERPAVTPREQAEQALADAQQALKETDETRDTLDLLLSLLQGGAILAGLALGAAAYFGFRNSKETREDLEELVEKVTPVIPYLSYLSELAAYAEDRDNLQEVVLNLLQASQEMNLRNYQEAYSAVRAVLKEDKNNPFALYIAGWLEMQDVEDRLDDGISHLEQVSRFRPHWSTASAAYGVALRRRAVKEKDDIQRNKKLREAEEHLTDALFRNRYLLDPSGESFWGPVGGIRRDMGNRLDEAIAAYRLALEVTPRSSYIMGNLAGLYLEKAREDPSILKDVIPAFEKTLEFSKAEVASHGYDYFHSMDIAMSTMMLAKKTSSFKQARESLEDALKLGDAKPEKLHRSYKAGWWRLWFFCPDDDEWGSLKTQLEWAKDRMKTELKLTADDSKEPAELP